MNHPMPSCGPRKGPGSILGGGGFWGEWPPVGNMEKKTPRLGRGPPVLFVACRAGVVLVYYNKNPLHSRPCGASGVGAVGVFGPWWAVGEEEGGKKKMAVVSMKQLLEAGVHFGHQTRRWNPKMAPYIFTERNGIYIIDLQKTVRKLEEAYMFVRDLSAERTETVLFVGTKKQAQDSIREEATRAGAHYVNARWLGGMMTNFSTIRGRIARLTQLKRWKRTAPLICCLRRKLLSSVEIEKLEKFLGGIKEMEKLPAALFSVTPSEEKIAVAEAEKLGISDRGYCGYQLRSR